MLISLKILQKEEIIMKIKEVIIFLYRYIINFIKNLKNLIKINYT